MAEVPTPDELRDLLATVLAGVAGGQISDWRDKVGLVARRSMLENIRSNSTGKPATSRRSARPFKSSELLTHM